MSEVLLPMAAEFDVDGASRAEADRPREHCGVWAIWDPGNPAILDNAFVGLKGVQHRGEGGAGIAVVSPTASGIQLLSGEGLVVKVFGEDGSGMNTLPQDSYAANGHTSWPTDSSKEKRNQPIVGELCAVAHNGQFTNKEELAAKYGIRNYTTDSDVVAQAINHLARQLNGDVERATLQLLPELRGAFCMTILTPDKLIAVRDRNGVRPLQLGITETGGYIVASEFMAIDNVPGATHLREIEPAEMIVIDGNGPPRSGEWTTPDPAACMLEYVYLANKDTTLNGVHIGTARRGFGKKLAKYLVPGLDMISPVPNGANQAAHGLSDETGLPNVPALIINPAYRYGRSFIQPDKASRDKMAEGKLIINPVREVAKRIAGKAIGLLDDSMVRSTMAKKTIPKLRRKAGPKLRGKAGGAKRVDMLIASAPYTGVCELGVDTPDPSQLIAARTKGNVELMRQEIGADNLVFISRADMHEVVGKKVCDFCLGGSKPNLIPEVEVETRFQQLSDQLSPAITTA